MAKYTQFYSLHTVKNKVFVGDVKLSEVIAHGNFGIGTFNNIDGEMIALDGTIYRTMADGSAEAVHDLDEKTPYAIITQFKPDIHRTIGPANLSEVLAAIDAMRADLGENIVSVEVTGTFRWVRTRAPEPSYPPYKDLEEIIADQPNTTLNGIAGDIVGFYTPHFLGELGVPGYHLHFIDESRRFGGHLQDAYLDDGVIKLQCLEELKVVRPGGAAAASLV